MRARTKGGGLLLLCLALGGAAAARFALVPTITPTTHDFGDNVVGVMGNWGHFMVTLPAGQTHTDQLVGGISGPNAAEFRIDRTPGLIPGATPASMRTDCQNAPIGTNIGGPLPVGTCEIVIEFVPTSIGDKTATLTIFDYKIGGQVSATLKGKGIYGCRAVVVPCNYAAFYSGTISWRSTLNFSAPSGNGIRTERRVEDITATITNGRAVCSGTVREDRTDTDGEGSQGWLRASVGGTPLLPVAGATPSPAVSNGLFAVEFDEDLVFGKYYLVTIACPSEEGTDSSLNVKTGGKDGNPIESTPAALNGREMTSDRQPAALGIGMDLKGQISHASTDRDNGSGMVVITWDLKGQKPPAGSFSRRPPPP